MSTGIDFVPVGVVQAIRNFDNKRVSGDDHDHRILTDTIHAAINPFPVRSIDFRGGEISKDGSGHGPKRRGGFRMSMQQKSRLTNVGWT